MAKPHIRKTGIVDAEILAALHAESFGEAKWNVAQITDSLALPTTCGWIAHEKGTPRGFILCQIASHEAEILTFCTQPAARRTGIGKNLLQAAIESARSQGAKNIFLEVAVDNQVALGLYEKTGFRITGKRANYYRRDGHAVDAVLLSLDL